MTDIVNWEFLEKQLNSFHKSARSEVVKPADRVYFEQPKQNTSEESSTEYSNDNQGESRDSYISNRSVVGPDEVSESEPNYIEIHNHKGKIKKIDPDDYNVEIQANNKTVFTGVLSKIASGMYSKILDSHGEDQALSCLIKDYVKSPDLFLKPKLSFIQAKMAITSLRKTLGHIPDLSDITNRVDDLSRQLISEWLKK